MLSLYNLFAPTPIPTGGVPCTTAATTGATNAYFTLLGAAITASVALTGIFVKAWLDRKSDQAKHALEVEKLEFQLAADRDEALRVTRRKVAASFLQHTHEIYTSATRARRTRREEPDDDTYLSALRNIEPTAAQGALEEWRLVAGDGADKAADELWSHLRSHPVPRGHDLSSGSWMSWKEDYWVLRGTFIEKCKKDVLGAPGCTVATA
jgi:hypothetical protein